MAEFTNVIIGIQARSTSTRFPRKIHALLDGKSVLRHVIDACDRSARYMNNHAHATKTMIKVAVVCPYGDELIPEYRKRATIIEGPEDDVLERYKILTDRLDADYIVRITADCPLIPPYLITKHIKTAVVNRYDYLSNVDENCRTAIDGVDCEVISRKLMLHMHEQANEKAYREHVTLFARKCPPDWAHIGHIVNFLDMSSLKLSVDTVEDFERIKVAYENVKRACEIAEAKHGKSNLHRF